MKKLPDRRDKVLAPFRELEAKQRRDRRSFAGKWAGTVLVVSVAAGLATWVVAATPPAGPFFMIASGTFFGTVLVGLLWFPFLTHPAARARIRVSGDDVDIEARFPQPQLLGAIGLMMSLAAMFAFFGLADDGGGSFPGGSAAPWALAVFMFLFACILAMMSAGQSCIRISGNRLHVRIGTLSAADVELTEECRTKYVVTRGNTALHVLLDPRQETVFLGRTRPRRKVIIPDIVFSGLEIGHVARLIDHRIENAEAPPIQDGAASS
ncbi:hypothetical protein ACFORJ_12200 [Corynebacterium hansenii]|uniref:PH domain-containing protein n=1 Tax=Corynebacterium hansenii TaxID=394964 RepID=A0ABV7ZUW0_9CORY|nr:hypothetical protein [Corynebacterium hansenii]WJZ00064.1 hypothetical protein CHAN_07250 [Corynebacterium hansenii]